jgi:hypothetical protein
MLIIAKPSQNQKSIELFESGSSLGTFSRLDVRDGLEIVVSGSTAIVRIAGSTEVGAVMMNAGDGPRMHLPLTSPDTGWLVNDDGYLLIVE